MWSACPIRESEPCFVRRRGGVEGFSLLELLVAMAVMAIILVVVTSMVDHSSEIWKRSSRKIETLQSARASSDLLTRNLSQATLNTYLDYDDPVSPANYLRKSELRYYSGPAGVHATPGTPGTGQAVFFQAPANFSQNPASAGLDGLLNTCGYYVEFGSDDSFRPGFATAAPRYRYRLMQLIVPTETPQSVYSTNADPKAWFANHLPSAEPLADNVIAMVIRPVAPGQTPPDLTANYIYDTAAAFSGIQPPSSHQLPPVIELTMIVIDEESAQRMESGTGQPTEISTLLDGKFQEPDKFDNDLKDVTDGLNALTPPVRYRVFTSAVPIRESQWTK